MDTQWLPDERSLRRQARVAGGLYLLIIATAGFAEGFVRSSLIVAGDPAATAHNIQASAALFRLGIIADLVAFMADAGVAVLLYIVLRGTNETVALLAMVFRLLAHPLIASLNLLNPIGALLILEGSGPLRMFPRPELEQLAMLAIDLHGHGYLIAGAFFGIHCALLGQLLYRSEWFPRILGILLWGAAAGYLSEACAVLTASAFGTLARGLVVATAGIGETSLCLFLLIRGIRSPSPPRTAPAGSA